MKQLMMYLTMDKKFPELDLPQGYSLSKYKGDEDVQPWINCCLNGRLFDETNCEKGFQNAIGNHPYVVPKNDVFFLDHYGEHIGTATGYIKMIDNQKVGDLHMVAHRIIRKVIQVISGQRRRILFQRNVRID